MTHRDVFSLPLLVGSFTASSWLPFGLSLSELGTGMMYVLGVALICTQIRYYWRNTK